MHAHAGMEADESDVGPASPGGRFATPPPSPASVGSPSTPTPPRGRDKGRSPTGSLETYLRSAPLATGSSPTALRGTPGESARATTAPAAAYRRSPASARSRGSPISAKRTARSDGASPPSRSALPQLSASPGGEAEKSWIRSARIQREWTWELRPSGLDNPLVMFGPQTSLPQPEERVLRSFHDPARARRLDAAGRGAKDEVDEGATQSVATRLSYEQTLEHLNMQGAVPTKALFAAVAEHESSSDDDDGGGGGGFDDDGAAAGAGDDAARCEDVARQAQEEVARAQDAALEGKVAELRLAARAAQAAARPARARGADARRGRARRRRRGRARSRARSRRTSARSS